MRGSGKQVTLPRSPWAKKRFISTLSIDPYLGTLNLEILDLESLQVFNQLNSMGGKEINPEDPALCRARCYPVLIAGQLKGAIALPPVDGYPENKMELIASQNIKEALSVKAGNDLEGEIL